MPVLSDGNIPQLPEVSPKLESPLPDYDISPLLLTIFMRSLQFFGYPKTQLIAHDPAHMKTHAGISSSRLGEALWLVADSPSVAGLCGLT